jgi:hypothetical protein
LPDLVEDPVYARLLAAPLDALFQLYADLLPGTDPKDAAGLAAVARALKDRARAGELDAEREHRVALLVFCMVDAPNPVVAFHLAKALAAFGREAQQAAPYVVDWVLETRVVDDESYWAFDGLLWALAFLGGPAAGAMFDAIRRDAEPRVAKKRGIYDGALSLEERAAHHAQTLKNARLVLLSQDPGRWRERKTELQRTGAAPKKAANWKLRR